MEPRGASPQETQGQCKNSSVKAFCLFFLFAGYALRTQIACACALVKAFCLGVAGLCVRSQIAFEGEDGIDSGGLGKDFFVAVSEALAPKGGGQRGSAGSGPSTPAAPPAQPPACPPRFFRPTPSGACVEIQPGGGQGRGWLAVGRFLGKALVDRQLVPGLPLAPPLLKQLLNKPIGIDDLK